MGGRITSYYEIKYSPDATGIILTGPAVAVGDDISPLLIRVSKLMSGIAPRLATTVLDGNLISRDPAEVEKYNNDPLNYRGGIRARVGAEMLKAIQHVEANPASFKNPVLIMHGTADGITAPRGSQALYDGASSADKTLRMWDGLYHELINEPEKADVISEMIAWMDARL